MTARAVSALRIGGNAVALSSSVAVEDKANTDTAPSSVGKFSNACDPQDIRRKHPERWRGFLHAHYPTVVAVKWAFGVDYNTAKHWWNGTNAPQGWAIEFALKAVPGAAVWLATDAHKIPGAGVVDGTLGLSLQADLTVNSPSQAVNSPGSFALSGAFSGAS